MTDRLKLLPWLTAKRQITPDGKATMNVPVVERSCGDCTACCTIMPVAEIGKGANEACQFLSAGCGCSIYKTRPNSCFAWSCLWVLDAGIPEELRPDRSHIIIDMMADTVKAEQPGGKIIDGLMVMVAWMDPNFPDSYRNPLVREIMQEVAEKIGIPTLVRTSVDDAFVVAAPCLAGGKEWHEPPSRVVIGSQGPA